MIYIGVDPGKNGGYALICDNEVDVHPWDDQGFVTWLIGVKAVAKANGEHIFAAVEKVGAMPRQGVSSTFNFGKSAGYIEGVLSALGIGFQLVPPVKWKREFSLIGKDKRASVATCRKLFPGLDLKRTDRCRTESDGEAEAVLICLYAMRHFGNGVMN